MGPLTDPQPVETVMPDPMEQSVLSGGILPPAPGQADEDPDAPQDDKHFENLAEILSDDFLDTLAKDCLSRTQRDQESSEEWRDYYAKGIEQLGYDRSQDTRDTPFPGASAVTHPLLAESQIDFQARAMKALWPANGPVKTQIIGKQTPEKAEQAKRVRTLMNHDLTSDPEYRAEQDTMMMVLPIAGSTFKKRYWDHAAGIFRSEFVKPEDFVVHYGERYLKDCTSYTHLMYPSETFIRRQIAAEVWRDIEIGSPTVNVDSSDRVKVVTDKVEGRQPPETTEDGSFEIHEQTIDRDDDELRELEPEDTPDIPLSYVVTINKDTGKVFAVRRNWKRDDKNFTKIVSYTHYKCLPWTGFYGIGLPHVLGGIARAATGALRAEMDSAMVSAVPSGIRLRGGRVSGQNIAFRPFQWTEIDAPGVGDINKIAMSLPTKGPDPILFELIQYLDKKGAEFASVASQTIADGQSNLPVGSVLALIEQDSVVYSAIHARLHAAQQDELQGIAELYRENLDDEVTRDTFDGELIASWRDFDGVMVLPVSDPRIFSETQRVGRAQAKMQLVQQATEQGVNADKRSAFVEMARTLDFDDAEDMFPPPEQAQPLDPVSEVAAMTAGKPAKAFPGQDHKSHVDFLTSVAQDPQYGQLMMKVGPLLQALVCDHLAMLLHDEMQLATHQPLPPPGTPMDPQQAAQISTAVAQASKAISAQRAQAAQQAQQQAQGSAGQGQGDMQALTAVEMADVQRKQQADADKKEIELAKIRSNEQSKTHDLQVKVAVEDAKIQSQEKIAAAELSTDLIDRLGTGSDHPHPDPESVT